jgi:hypothetical protein
MIYIHNHRRGEISSSSFNKEIQHLQEKALIRSSAITLMVSNATNLFFNLYFKFNAQILNSNANFVHFYSRFMLIKFYDF